MNPTPNLGPLDRFVIDEGRTCWHTPDKCPDCGEAMATNGKQAWCHAGCPGVVETLGVSDAEVEAIRRSVTAGGSRLA